MMRSLLTIRNIKQCSTIFQYSSEDVGHQAFKSFHSKDHSIKTTDEPIGNEQRFALLRVDTHGNRFIVQQNMKFDDAKELEKNFDLLPHHQGYYVVNQIFVAEELKRTF